MKPNAPLRKELSADTSIPSYIIPKYGLLYAIWNEWMDVYINLQGECVIEWYSRLLWGMILSYIRSMFYVNIRIRTYMTTHVTTHIDVFDDSENT